MKQTVVIAVSLSFIVLWSQGACSKSSNTEAGATIPVDTSNGKKDSTTKPPVNRRYLALGDSYTIGESVAENERYPRQLQDSLSKYNININDLKIIARTGWTTSELLNAIAAAPPAGTYDLVTLLIGVNNQYRGESLQTYSAEFTSLLDKCKQYAGNDKNRVVVISIPDYSVVPFANYYDTVKIRKELEAFNKTNRDITVQNGIKYVDVFALSQEAKYNKSLVAKDSLHFSGLEYAKWTKMLIPLAKEILK